METYLVLNFTLYYFHLELLDSGHSAAISYAAMADVFVNLHVNESLHCL